MVNLIYAHDYRSFPENLQEIEDFYQEMRAIFPELERKDIAVNCDGGMIDADVYFKVNDDVQVIKSNTESK